jgi:Peptidase A4 family
LASDFLSLRPFDRPESLERDTPIETSLTSTNWAGYVAIGGGSYNSPTANTVSYVQGTWTVPNVTGGPNSSYSSVWVGIDGVGNNTVEQVGTEQDISSNGTATYYAWYEMAPVAATKVLLATTGGGSFTIHAGDVVSAGVSYLGFVTGTTTEAFAFGITNLTTGKSFFYNGPHGESPTYQNGLTAQRGSAEWIVEDPTSAATSNLLPYANPGSVTFSNAVATIGSSTLAPISSLTHATETLKSPSGSQTLASPTSLAANGLSFTVNAVPEPSTTCAAVGSALAVFAMIRRRARISSR